MQVNLNKNTIMTATGRYYHEWIEAVYKNNDTKRNDAIRLARIILFFHLSVIIMSLYFKNWYLFVKFLHCNSLLNIVYKGIIGKFIFLNLYEVTQKIFYKIGGKKSEKNLKGKENIETNNSV